MLHTEMRPSNLDDFLGNQALKEALKKAIGKGIQVFLFTGSSGCGKTTLGRIIAKSLSISDANVNIFNAADTRGIDTIRDVILDSNSSSLFGSKKIYIFEESHQLSVPAQESLLQFLEEPPKDVYIVLTTTNPEKLKDTLKRRCFVGEVRPLLRSEVLQLLKKSKKRISQNVFEKAFLESGGSPGKFLKILDTIEGLEDEKALEMISSFSDENRTIIDICRLMVDRNRSDSDKWNRCRDLLKGLDIPPEQGRQIILSYLNKCILNSHRDDLIPMLLNFTENYYESGLSGLILSVYSSIFND